MRELQIGEKVRHKDSTFLPAGTVGTIVAKSADYITQHGILYGVYWDHTESHQITHYGFQLIPITNGLDRVLDEI